MNIYITTDTHFSHTQLIEYGRPADFEEKIKRNLKNTIKETDLLIHLGDVCIGKDIVNNQWFKENLKCRTFLVRGNHDKKSISWYLEHGWDSVSDRLDINLFGKRICFTHLPVAWDGYFDMNIHGHFHDTDHRRNEPKFNGIICGYNKLIALEFTNYNPVSLNSLKKLLLTNKTRCVIL